MHRYIGLDVHAQSCTAAVLGPDDDQNTTITFGDGVRGARLPSGTNNVLATYRVGAGAAAPPADSIKQLARPAPGLLSVESPVAARAGRDPDTPEQLRSLAPQTAPTCSADLAHSWSLRQVTVQVPATHRREPQSLSCRHWSSQCSGVLSSGPQAPARTTDKMQDQPSTARFVANIPTALLWPDRVPPRAFPHGR
jgi:hypothetical protein